MSLSKLLVLSTLFLSFVIHAQTASNGDGPGNNSTGSHIEVGKNYFWGEYDTDTIKVIDIIDSEKVIVRYTPENTMFSSDTAEAKKSMLYKEVKELNGFKKGDKVLHKNGTKRFKIVHVIEDGTAVLGYQIEGTYFSYEEARVPLAELKH